MIADSQKIFQKVFLNVLAINRLLFYHLCQNENLKKMRKRFPLSVVSAGKNCNVFFSITSFLSYEVPGISVISLS